MITSVSALGRQDLAGNSEQHQFIVQWMTKTALAAQEREKTPDEGRAMQYAIRRKDVELQAGFRAMRRAEMYALMRSYDLPYDAGNRDSVLVQLEAYWRQGAFNGSGVESGESGLTIHELRKVAKDVFGKTHREAMALTKDDLLAMINPARTIAEAGDGVHGA